MLNNQHSQPLRCHTNESPDMPVRFKQEGGVRSHQTCQQIDAHSDSVVRRIRRGSVSVNLSVSTRILSHEPVSRLSAGCLPAYGNE